MLLKNIWEGGNHDVGSVTNSSKEKSLVPRMHIIRCKGNLNKRDEAPWFSYLSR